MYGVNIMGDGDINLQATLSAASAGSSMYNPHHPITCTGNLWHYDDGSFACDHIKVDAYDERLIYCINHSIAFLIMEIARKELG